FVWRNEELSSQVPIRPDGKISIPLVEDMVAAGKTTSQLARDIEEVLAEFIRSPTVNVIIGQQGPSNQVQVVGEVAAPQSIPFREGLRLLDVLVAVGGLSDFAAGNRSRVSRLVGDRQIECTVKAKRLLDGDMSQNIRVYPGDVLIVPESRF
ncbi:MAG: XrtA/PEP-CTERM system exopolysaccharide export protein, partial [Pseudomonadota bacterium]